jgi:hypothetical protein
VAITVCCASVADETASSATCSASSKAVATIAVRKCDDFVRVRRAIDRRGLRADF